MLTSETVFIPAASYIESNLCKKTINEYRYLFDTGQLVLVGGEANMIDFATAKLLQYEPGSERFKKYEAALASSTTTTPFRSRMRSATADIKAAWLQRLNDLSGILKGLAPAEFSDFESRWAEVPEWLGKRAFTPEYAVRGLFHPAPTSRTELVVAHRVGSHVNSEYFRSYTRELNAGLVTDLTYLHSPHASVSRSVDLPFRTLIRELESRGVLDLVLGARPERLINIRHDPDVAAAIVVSLRASTSRGQRPRTLIVTRHASTEARPEPTPLPPTTPPD